MLTACNEVVGYYCMNQMMIDNCLMSHSVYICVGAVYLQIDI